MAIIKIGPPLSGIRGTIGGITYSANAATPYAKLWAQGPKKNTPKQSVQRAFQSQMPLLWNDMTDVQRAAWRTFAADPDQELTNSLGEAYYASGFNWFCKCNVRLLRQGLTPEVPVPSQARPGAPTIDDFRVCKAGTEVDLCTCGVATASNDDGVHFATMAFDDNIADASRWMTALGVVTGWLRYDHCDPVNVKRYRIYPRQLAQLNQSPAAWTFQVWSAGAWQTIHSVTAENWAAVQWYDFYCPNPYTETDYRINISANQGSANRLSMVEFEMYAADIGASVIIYPEFEFFGAPAFDLVGHIAMSNTPKLLWQYPGFHEIAVSSSPPWRYQLIQTQLEDTFGAILESRSWFLNFHRQTEEGIRSAAATQRTETIGY